MAISRSVIVAGAGIGGLTAALALAAKGFHVTLLERAARLEETGAGLQLSPNATRILTGLGVDLHLRTRLTAPEAISVFNARSGRETVRIPLGQAAEFRYGAPYWLTHRADLQAALLARARENSDIEIRLGWQFEDAAVHAKGITVMSRAGDSRRQDVGLALIGADGVWSAVRQHLFPQSHAKFSGRIAWRGTLDARQLPREFALPRVQLWLGRNAHLVAYPMSGGARINIVAIVRGEWNRPGWNEAGDASEISSHFARRKWSNAARMMIGTVDGWRRWALFELPDIGAWSRGPATLLGDAAHAMLPFAAQGSGMAIEDAAVMASCLGDDASNATEALARYAAMRRLRIAHVRRAARTQGMIYHLGGPAALARDLTMRMLGGPRLLGRQDWIYDWRAR